MRDIAAATGILPGSIYYHFDSKDELLLQVYRAGVDQITSAFNLAVTSFDDPWDRLRAGMSALIQAVSQEGAQTRVIFKVQPDEVPAYKNQLVAIRDEFEALFRATIDDLPLNPWVDKHLLRLMLLGAGNHTQLWFSETGQYSAEEVADQFCAFVRETVA